MINNFRVVWNDGVELFEGLERVAWQPQVNVY